MALGCWKDLSWEHLNSQVVESKWPPSSEERVIPALASSFVFSLIMCAIKWKDGQSAGNVRGLKPFATLWQSSNTSKKKKENRCYTETEECNLHKFSHKNKTWRGPLLPVLFHVQFWVLWLRGGVWERECVCMLLRKRDSVKRVKKSKENIEVFSLEFAHTERKRKRISDRQTNNVWFSSRCH